MSIPARLITYLKVGVLAVVTGAAALAIAAPASASTSASGDTTLTRYSAADPKPSKIVTPQASVVCDSLEVYSTRWGANCRVYSGQARAVTVCTGGRVIYGSWVGVGYWRFGGDCWPNALLSYAVETRG